ncbi:hypothetical protein [Hanstruepera marina]|uniref:hypothetical protein n=1 Tax=Hanstruepera marina TaxID=2873265 RepID=UPI001CA724E4|nr:hypothetical protein [Hanstruepera marina]
MIKKTILLFAILFAITSCKDEQPKKAEVKPQNTTSVEKKEAPKKLVLELDVEMTQPEDLVLFSNEIFLNNGQFMNLRVIQKINSNETSKHVVFEFPENVKPDFNLALSLGNTKEKEVKLSNIKFSYGDKNINVTQDEMNKYLTFNRFTSYNKDTNIITTKKVGGKLNPVVFLKKDQLLKLIK